MLREAAGQLYDIALARVAEVVLGRLARRVRLGWLEERGLNLAPLKVLVHFAPFDAVEGWRWGRAGGGGGLRVAVCGWRYAGGGMRVAVCGWS